MFDCFLSQCLVLLLVFFCSARFFFLKISRVDSFAVFSPLALIISLLIFYCFGFSVINLAVFFLALITFFTNFRAVLRVYSSLIVDSYSGVFIIFSVLILILTLLLGALIVFTRPVKYSEKDFNVTKKTLTLTGSTTDLRIRENILQGQIPSGRLYVYEPVVNDEITEEIYSSNPVLIFSPGIRAEVLNYEPYLELLAQKGYKVIAADFYTKDLYLISDFTENPFIKALLESRFLRRFAALKLEEYKKDWYSQIADKEKAQAIKKYSALSKLALELYGDQSQLFYIVDGIDFDSIYSVVEKFKTEPYDNALGFFSLNRVDEYRTSGYGFIEQTDVFTAWRMGLERENKFFIPRYVAGKTIKSIEEQKKD